MFKKIWFGIFVFSAFFSLYAQESGPFPKIEEISPKDRDRFRYATFGMIGIIPSIGIAPSAGFGIRTQRGHWGNDFSLSGASFLIINGLSAQYSRLYYFKKDGKNTGYCGLGPALNYINVSNIYSRGFSHAVFPS